MSGNTLQQIVDLNDQVERLYSNLQYKEGFSLARQACRLARASLGEEHSEFGRALANLADMYFVRGNLADSEMPQARLDMNGRYSATEDYAAAEALCCRALEVLEATVGTNSRLFCRAVNILMASRIGLGHDPSAFPPPSEIDSKASRCGLYIDLSGRVEMGE